MKKILDPNELLVRKRTVVSKVNNKKQHMIDVNIHKQYVTIELDEKVLNRMFSVNSEDWIAMYASQLSGLELDEVLDVFVTKH